MQSLFQTLANPVSLFIFLMISAIILGQTIGYFLFSTKSGRIFYLSTKITIIEYKHLVGFFSKKYLSSILINSIIYIIAHSSYILGFINYFYIFMAAIIICLYYIYCEIRNRKNSMNEFRFKMIKSSRLTKASAVAAILFSYLLISFGGLAEASDKLNPNHITRSIGLIYIFMVPMMISSFYIIEPIMKHSENEKR